MGQIFAKRADPVPRRRVCLLVDADNACPQDIDEVMEHACGLGDVVTKRIFGGGHILEAWKSAALRHRMDVAHQYAFTAKKNASDIAMTIGAMDLLRDGDHGVFCLMTSDSDFTPLVHRLCKAGMLVHGFGSSLAPKALVESCGRSWHEIRTIQDSGNVKAAPTTRSVHDDRPVFKKAVAPVTRSASLRERVDASPALKRKIAGAVASNTANGKAALTSIGVTLNGCELPGKLRLVLDALGYDVVVTGDGRDHVRF